MRRSGSVCDTLVFLLVATLLPAWLLGHLFLMFFPAQDSGMAVQGGTPDRLGSVAALADSDSSGDSQSEGMIDLLTEDEKPDTTTSSHSELGQQDVQWGQKVVEFESTISNLQKENENLSLKATEFESLKFEQQKEIDELKKRLQQNSMQNGQGQIASMSTQLREAKDDYTRLEDRFKLLQDEKSQLAREFSDLESKNEQLAMAQQSTGPDNTKTAEALVAASEKLLAEANEEKSRLQNRVKELATALDTAQASFTSQKRELDDANNQLQQLNAKFAQIRKSRGTASAPSENTKPGRSNLIETSRRANRPSATEQYREYVSSRGNRSRLAFIKWIEDEQVVVRSFLNKQLYQVPIERFSDADQKYLKSLKPTNAQ